jgi:hypothetical protein
MAKVSLSEAARMAGKSRVTIHRHIEKGLLAKEIDQTGNPVIDLSELERVYGSLRYDTAATEIAVTDETVNNRSMIQMENENLHERLALLADERERERQTLREMINDLRTERDRLLKLLEEQTSSVKLLTDNRNKQKPPHLWWRWHRS